MIAKGTGGVKKARMIHLSQLTLCPIGPVVNSWSKPSKPSKPLKHYDRVWGAGPPCHDAPEGLLQRLAIVCLSCCTCLVDILLEQLLPYNMRKT